jgi:epoxyqueuosine reductase
VCPWNQRFADANREKGLTGNVQLGYPDPIEELSLSPQEFNRKFKGSPIKRAKRRGYLRNAAVALGNLKPTTAVPPLIKSLLDETEPLVRGHSAWALGQIGGDLALEALREVAVNEEDPYVVGEILAALGE